MYRYSYVLTVASLMHLLVPDVCVCVCMYECYMVACPVRRYMFPQETGVLYILMRSVSATRHKSQLKNQNNF